MMSYYKELLTTNITVCTLNIMYWFFLFLSVPAVLSNNTRILNHYVVQLPVVGGYNGN